MILHYTYQAYGNRQQTTLGVGVSLLILSSPGSVVVVEPTTFPTIEGLGTTYLAIHGCPLYQTIEGVMDAHPVLRG